MAFLLQRCRGLLPWPERNCQVLPWICAVKTLQALHWCEWPKYLSARRRMLRWYLLCSKLSLLRKRMLFTGLMGGYALEILVSVDSCT
ncbi:unnamed protein product [Effrenium voratum]|nr:unnamed protein product [Effrenium voratum]